LNFGYSRGLRENSGLGEISLKVKDENCLRLKPLLSPGWAEFPHWSALEKGECGWWERQSLVFMHVNLFASLLRLSEVSSFKRKECRWETNSSVLNACLAATK